MLQRDKLALISCTLFTNTYQLFLCHSIRQALESLRLQNSPFEEIVLVKDFLLIFISLILELLLVVILELKGLSPTFLSIKFC